MEKLLGYLEQYKQGTYQAFKYQGMKEVISSCMEGKTFVFKGGKGLFSCECYCPTILAILFTSMGGAYSMPGYLYSPTGLPMMLLGIAFCALAALVLVSKFRSFIVAGPDGLAFRKWFKLTYFDWLNIADIHTTHVIGGASGGVYVRIQPKDAKPVTLNTSLMRSREFSWSGRDLMISQVIYAHWAMKTKVQGVQTAADNLLKDFGGPSNLQDPTAPP